MVDASVERWDKIRANAQAIFFTEQAVPETATDTRASGSAGSGSGGYQPFGGTAHRLTADEETTKETDEVQKDSAVSDESNTDSAESNTDSPISLKPDIIR